MCICRDRVVYTNEQIVEELAVSMVYKLIQELEDVFRPNPIPDSFSVLNLTNLPDSIVALEDYGNVICYITIWSKYKIKLIS